MEHAFQTAADCHHRRQNKETAQAAVYTSDAEANEANDERNACNEQAEDPVPL